MMPLYLIELITVDWHNNKNSATDITNNNNKEGSGIDEVKLSLLLWIGTDCNPTCERRYLFLFSLRCAIAFARFDAISNRLALMHELIHTFPHPIIFIKSYSVGVYVTCIWMFCFCFVVFPFLLCISIALIGFPSTATHNFVPIIEMRLRFPYAYIRLVVVGIYVYFLFIWYLFVLLYVDGV